MSGGAGAALAIIASRSSQVAMLTTNSRVASTFDRVSLKAPPRCGPVAENMTCGGR